MNPGDYEKLNDYQKRASEASSKGDYDSVIKINTEMIRLVPENGLVYYNRGLAYANKGDYIRSISDYNDAIRLGVDNPDFNAALAHYNRGAAYKKRGLYGKAIEDFEIALSLDPSDSDARDAIEKTKYVRMRDGGNETAAERNLDNEIKKMKEKEAREAKEAAEKEAAEKLRKAAEQGDTEAQFKLGNSYFTGQGEIQDYAKAAEWFSKAAAQGHGEAKDFLTKIEKEKVQRAKEAAERAAFEKRMQPLWRFGLVLQLVVTAAAFFIFFYTQANETLRNSMESLHIVLQLALPVGVPALVIGIISLLFRKKSHSGWGIGLIIIIDIVLSISSAIINAKGFWGFIGYLILSLIVLSISAIPGFLMATGELGKARQ